MKKIKKQAAQGDLLIQRVSELPDGIKKIDGTTVAYGEATGHHHSFDRQVQLYDGGVRNGVPVKYAHVVAGAILDHQEHEGIEFPEPGFYEIRQQRENTPLGWRLVVD